MPQALKPRGGAAKCIVCPYCSRPTEVALRAMSIFCPHCRKRVILENYKITSYYAVREFFTCGDIVVEKKGQVIATIRAGNLTVKGKVQGDVCVQGTVKLLKGAAMKGSIEAPVVDVEPGASFDGALRIGPVAPRV